MKGAWRRALFCFSWPFHVFRHAKVWRFRLRTRRRPLRCWGSKGYRACFQPEGPRESTQAAERRAWPLPILVRSRHKYSLRRRIFLQRPFPANTT